MRGLQMLSLMMLGALTGCASSTTLRSEPSGAKVFLDGRRVGNTPYRHTDSRPSLSKLQVRLEKEGYQPVETVIQRNESVEPGAVVGALFFLIPVLWVMGYDDQHFYELTPLEQAPSRDGKREARPEAPEGVQ